MSETLLLESRREKLRRLANAAPELKRPALVRVQRVRTSKPARFVAYDFETTRIKPGTPRPLWLTAYSLRPNFAFEGAIDNMQHLHDLLVAQFLTDDLADCKFVAWAGNNFDAYFVSAAMLADKDYIIRPYLTRSNSLRGLRIIRAEDIDRKDAPAWEFLDGMAMLGLPGVKLDDFLAKFAPNHRKLVGAIDFEKEEFDSKNPKHRAYAIQDSIGLWHGMEHAQQIIHGRFNEPLRATLGGVAIRILKAHIPRSVTVGALSKEHRTIVRDFVVRGGFCYCVRRYHGPIWKYDLNQAYAAAMRETLLPAGYLSPLTAPPVGQIAWIARVEARNPNNQIPFYYRAEVDGRVRSIFGMTKIAETWLTSIELQQLEREGWQIQYKEILAWDSVFDMREYVDKLETARMTCDGGPKGAIGTMLKGVGNHSYGKTLEELDPVEYMLAAECPPDFEPFYNDADSNPMEHLWFRTLYRTLPDGTVTTDEKPKDYHQPQFGAFVTAHVRMVVRRAALLNPEAWIYADTDCVIFTCDMTPKLDIDDSRYGAWKLEEQGEIFRIIAKKVYSEDKAEPKKRSAKGLHVKKLSGDDFARWYDGEAPQQLQVQRQNYITVMRGAEMFRAQLRKGTRVEGKI